MSDKKTHEEKPSKGDGKSDKKAPETVHLSAEELKRISGGAVAPAPPKH